MKRSQSSNARLRSRFSRSGSLASPRGKLQGWKTTIAVLLGATLLLVSVFYLQARLGGFGSSRGSDEREGEPLVAQGHKIKSLGRKASAGVESLGTKLEVTDLEEEEDGGEFERLDRAREQDLDEEDMEVDESVIEDVDVLRQEHDESRRDEDEDEDLDGDDEQQQQQQQQGEVSSGSDDEEEEVEAAKGGGSDPARNKTEKRLERLGQIKSLERHGPEVSGNESKSAGWDSVLGVIKVPVDGRSAGLAGRKLGLGRESLQQAGNDGGQSFSSDDEPLDVTQVVDFEDALFSRKEKLAGSKVLGSSQKQKVVPPKNVFDARFAKRILRPPVDPIGNALLQDPDTVEPWGLTKSDRAISRSYRKSAMEDVEADPGDSQEKNIAVEEKVAAGNGRRKELLELPDQRNTIRRRAKGDNRRWGYFPGLDKMLLFSDFMERFLDEDCQIKVFQAWNSPPWSYTVRHQRGLESLFHFHPKACVVVFSETMEFDFFHKFAGRGLKVAVVRPNLEELLYDTSTEMFASVWTEWRRVEKFYIHYGELLRLAALYKYGGIYLDCDVVVLKPLHSLQNTVGIEALEDGKTRLNGAVMIFNKGSSFLKECLDEYTATYDDELLDYNGADLLTRVARRPIHEKTNRTWEESEQELRVLPSSSFFPLNSSNITSYFYGPATSSKSYENKDDRIEILLESSYTLHLWNRQTKSLVPESNSVVGIALEQHCIWCSDVI